MSYAGTLSNFDVHVGQLKAQREHLVANLEAVAPLHRPRVEEMIQRTGVMIERAAAARARFEREHRLTEQEADRAYNAARAQQEAAARAVEASALAGAPGTDEEIGALLVAQLVAGHRVAGAMYAMKTATQARRDGLDALPYRRLADALRHGREAAATAARAFAPDLRRSSLSEVRLSLDHLAAFHASHAEALEALVVETQRQQTDRRRNIAKIVTAKEKPTDAADALDWQAYRNAAQHLVRVGNENEARLAAAQGEAAVRALVGRMEQLNNPEAA